MKKGGILQVFLNADLRCGHTGLSDLAKKQGGIKTEEISMGDFIVFINSARDKMKLYASGEVVAYLRLEKGRKINMAVIKELPKVFNGRSIDYPKALAEVIDQEIKTRRRGEPSYSVI